MIIKGGSRGSPKQLAYHLQRVDTNEHVSILELQHPVADLEDAFFCWQALSEGSRGKRGLYHANIDPAEQYELTPEQRLRAVEVLEEELGFQGQSRVVVEHQKHGRTHLHVVWCRMDYDTGTLRSDSQNYLKHEKASLRLELEFGHELVPGKHAKRDREKQPEFPKAEADHVQWQQAERTGMSAAERKALITGLRAAADNAQAFKNALAEAGYVLAKGDQRGMVLVDAAGEVFSLSKHVTDIKGKAFKAFMAPIDEAALPTVEEAKALQQQRQEETAVKAELRGAESSAAQGPEASKFLQPQAPAKVEEPAPAQPPSKFLPKADAPVPVSPPPAPEAKPFDYEFYANYNRQPAPQAPVVQPPAPVPPAPAPAPETPAPFDYSRYAPKPPAPAAPKAPAPVLAPAPPPPPAPPQPKVPDLAEGPKPTWIKERVRLVPVAPKQPGINFDAYAPQAPEPAAPDLRDLSPKEDFKGLQPPPAPKPKAPWVEREIFDLRKSILKIQKEECQKFAEQNVVSYKQHDIDLDGGNRTKMEDFDNQQRADLLAFRERLNPEPAKGIRGMMDALKQALNPQDDALTAAKQEDLALFKSQQAHDRRDYIKALEQGKVSELEMFRDRQLAEQAARERGYNAEIERRVAEFKEAKRLKANIGASMTKRREPLPSDPWMAQIGGIKKLSLDHLASAERSYDAWSRKQEYDFQNYVEYVQRQWEKIELPPVPQAAEPQSPKPAYDPATYAPKAAPKTDPWTDAEIKSQFNALQNDPEIERRIREFNEGRRIAAELEADERKREKDRGREGTEPPEEGKE